MTSKTNPSRANNDGFRSACVGSAIGFRSARPGDRLRLFMADERNLLIAFDSTSEVSIRAACNLITSVRARRLWHFHVAKDDHVRTVIGIQLPERSVVALNVDSLETVTIADTTGPGELWQRLEDALLKSENCKMDAGFQDPDGSQ
jgi:hypothetical protein